MQCPTLSLGSGVIFIHRLVKLPLNLCISVYLSIGSFLFHFAFDLSCEEILKKSECGWREARDQFRRFPAYFVEPAITP